MGLERYKLNLLIVRNMHITEAVKEAYHKLPKGAKNRAIEIHGCSQPYFNKIIKGKPKKLSVYYKALKSINQAAKEYQASIISEVESIEGIMVDPICKTQNVNEKVIIKNK